jgi:hypothetical protein
MPKQHIIWQKSLHHGCQLQFVVELVAALLLMPTLRQRLDDHPQRGKFSDTNPSQRTNLKRSSSPEPSILNEKARQRIELRPQSQ